MSRKPLVYSSSISSSENKSSPQPSIPAQAKEITLAHPTLPLRYTRRVAGLYSRESAETGSISLVMKTLALSPATGILYAEPFLYLRQLKNLRRSTPGGVPPPKLGAAYSAVTVTNRSVDSHFTCSSADAPFVFSNEIDIVSWGLASGLPIIAVRPRSISSL